MPTALLILLTICMIIGPAFLLLPSRQQKEQMALRIRARAAGLQVQLVSVDDPDPDPERYRSLTGKPLSRTIRCAAYRRTRKRESDWRDRAPAPWKVVRRSGAGDDGLPADWHWQDTLPGRLSGDLQGELKSGLTLLPNDVLAVEERGQVLSVFWQERGGLQGLEQIIELMQRLLQANLVEPEDDETRS